MTLAAIKNEISKRLREVRSDSLEFSDSPHFSDLRSLTADALGDVAMCTTAEELEAINGLLERIEDCWNLCRSDTLNIDSDDVLFEFDFVLDDGSDSEDDEDNDDEDSEEDDEDEESPDDEAKKRYDISNEIKAIEQWYDKLEGQGSPIHEARLKANFKNSVAELEAVEDRAALAIARNNYNERFRKLDKQIKRYNCKRAAKPLFDSTHKPESLKKPNTVRLTVGCIAFLTGLGYGILTAVAESRFIFLWPDWVYGITGAGLSYLLLSLLYAVATAWRNSISTVRRLSVTRLILAVFAAVGSLAIGLTIPQIGLIGAYIATLPFTLGGLAVYFIYRIKFAYAVRKKRKETRKR